MVYNKDLTDCWSAVVVLFSSLDSVSEKASHGKVYV